ncbi:MAG: hypothetical protein ACRDNM_00015 [Gaiellaceae bacterium]
MQSLERVLEPFGPERRQEVLSWAAEHMQATPLIAYLCAVGEPGDADWHEPDAAHREAWSTPKTYEFRIGEASPLDPDNTVFAIFHWHVQGAFVVYSFKTGLLQSGAALAVYSRDLVFNPRFASGPVTLDALHADLEYHTHATPWDDVDDGDPPPPRGGNGNGNPRPQASRS